MSSKIPNVCMKWCRKPAYCKYCEKLIETATPMVVVFFWNRGDDNNRSFNVKLYFHPVCWIKQGYDYLKLNPYTPGKVKRGFAPRLSPEDTIARNLLLRRYHRLKQRKRNLKTAMPDRILKEANLDIQMTDIMLDIAKVGGVPPAWVEAIT